MIKREEFLAKSDGQSIEKHTQHLLKLFDDFCNKYCDSFDSKTKLMIMLASEYHDLGKINSSFQTYIHKNINKNADKFSKGLVHYQNIINKDIPHGILSGAFVSKKRSEELGLSLEEHKVLVTAVINHHFRSLENVDSDEIIREIVNNDLLPLATTYYGLEYCKTMPIVKHNFFKPNTQHDITDSLWLKYAQVKGMLNKLDYGASAGEIEIEIAPENAKVMCKTAMQNKGFKLRACQEYMEHKEHKSVIMTASTGMGKTEAAMIWSANAKTFYSLPYKVSINAIYERICHDKYYKKEKCALLHSDTFSRLISGAKSYDGEINGNDIFKEYQAIKNLAYPFTVCTVDQLFLFPYLAHGTELVATTLSYSKVIIDEIQAYEPKILAKILRGLVMIDKMGGKFLIMTATLPPFIKDYLIKNIKEVEVSQHFFNPQIRHVPTLVKGEMDFEEIATEGESKKVLVICNTVARACDAYNNIKKHSTCSVNLLHSRFIQRDRLTKERDIKEFSLTTENGVWVSTQLVEASLDIDFDMLFTEMSTGDSLLQRMGRCYRSRTYDSEKPNVIVFDNKSGTGYGEKSIYDDYLYQRSVDGLSQYCGKPFGEEDKQKYIEYVYDTDAIKETSYYKRFLAEIKFLTEGLLAGQFTVSDAREKFREIESSKVIPFKFLGQAKDILNKIKNLSFSKANVNISLQKKILEEELNAISLQVNLFNKKRYQVHKDEDCNKAHLTVLTNEYDYEVGLKDITDEGGFL